jgi:PIN domain nuclease of toxin-antitoxin system
MAPREAAYLDTEVALWLASGALERLTPKARALLETADLLLSPMAFLELEYLSQIKLIRLNARDLMRKLKSEVGLRLCDLPFSQVAVAALDENWTQDPFDRMIVAQAKANGFSPLVSADGEISRHYPRTVW